MADPRHVHVARWGADKWNSWRTSFPTIAPDLSRVILSGGDLRRYDLRGANLREVSFRQIKLCDADLSQADLREADLREANLTGVKLSGANLSHANINGAIFLNTKNFQSADISNINLSNNDFSNTDFTGANLYGTDISNCNLEGAIFKNANLVGANFNKSNLEEADLSNTDLTEASLSQCCLIDANLSGSKLTNCWLWETQRSGWRIKNVACESIFWDRERRIQTRYRHSEFERVWAEKPIIMLKYDKGLQPIDFALLPTMVERIQLEHPKCKLHIRSIRDDGPSASVEIVFDDLANRDQETFDAEVTHLREELRFVHGQLEVYREQFLPLFRELTQMAKYNIGHIQGPAAIEGPQRTGDIYYSSNGKNLIGALTADLLADRSQWEKHVAQSRHANFLAELNKLSNEMDRQNPNVSILDSCLHSLKNMLESAAGTSVYLSIQSAIINLRNLVG